MFVYKDRKNKFTALVIVAVLVFGGLVMLFGGDTSSAEDDVPEVSEYGTVTVGGEETDAYEYLGIIYAVINDAEAEEEVGVYGISDSTAVAGKYVCVNSLTVGEDDDEVCYSVTTFLTEFASNAAGVTGSNLITAISIENYEKDCFKGLSLSGIIVSDAVTDEMMSEAGLGSADYTVFDAESTPADYTLNVSAGDINSNVVANYNDGEDSAEIPVYSGITTVIECPFENPGFDIDGYLDGSDNEVPEGAQAFVIGGALYLDGTAYAGSADVVSQWSENEDYLAEFEITIKLPFTEGVTFTGTYEMWMMYATVGIIVLLAVIGLSMMGYRIAMARKG
ncbi:MAG: hypothetical protein MJZ21_05765 [archaeon]|nr:hypothetical protein [archaeon]